MRSSDILIVIFTTLSQYIVVRFNTHPRVLKLEHNLKCLSRYLRRSLTVTLTPPVDILLYTTLLCVGKLTILLHQFSSNAQQKPVYFSLNCIRKHGLLSALNF